MGIPDLKTLCLEWDHSSDAFSKIVAATVTTLGVYQRELAAEFQVAESTVSRWSSGIARPHPRFQELVVAAIKRRLASAHRTAAEPSHRAHAVRRNTAPRHALAAKSHS